MSTISGQTPPLRAIFGRDYDSVAPEFQIIADETRNLEFAHICSELGSLIVAGVNLLSRDHFIMRPQLRNDSAAN